MKSISYIIPLYKGKQYIDQQVAQLSKTEGEYEIIFVEDGSKDGAAEYCRTKYNAENIHLIEKENGGIASARNTGLQHTKNTYVVFIDQDDTVDAGVISKAAEEMEQNELDVLFWTTKRIAADGNTLPCDTVLKNGIVQQDEKQECLRCALLRKPFEYISYFGHIWAGIYRKDAIDKNGITFKRFIDYEDDWLFVTDCLALMDKIGFVQDTGYYWLTNENSHSQFRKHIENYISKGNQLVDYFMRRCRDASLDEEECEEYLRQFVLLNAIRNLCSQAHTDSKEYKEIKAYIKANRRMMRNISPHYSDIREKLIIGLAIHRMMRLSVLFVRVYVMLRQKKMLKI